MSSLRRKINYCTFWTDSTIVLGWINTSANLLKPFVRNRPIEIQESTDVSRWRYVPSADNPADFLIRGMNPNLIESSILWWHGPSWLGRDETDWPSNNNIDSDLPELKPKIQSYMAVKPGLKFPFEKFSQLTRIKRVCAFILRFKDNCFLPKHKRSAGPLSVEVLDQAFTKLIHISQTNAYPLEYNALLKKRPLDKKSKILSLNPFLDNKGLLRVGGRISNSSFNFEKKFPIILSSKQRLTLLIFEHEHKFLLHVGPQQLLANIRESFWPVSARNQAKFVTHKCLKCYRLKATNVQPIMGNLPANRFLSGFPFQATGVDYAGPILVKNKQGRGAKLTKSHIYIFICLSTKCIHLELVSDLSADAFILALKRFISRRGKPVHIYSDNESNFVKANKELKEFGNFLLEHQQQVEESINNVGISWHFIPAYAPNFGGLWEAGVKSTKRHLKSFR